MKSFHAILSIATLYLGVVPTTSHAGDQPSASPQPLQLADVLAWKSIRSVQLSRDGQWLAYQLVPNEGDGEVILRKTTGDQERRFPCGKLPGFRFVPGQPIPVRVDLAFSEDSQWLAFTIHPTAKESKRLEKQKKPAHNKVALVNAATGDKSEFANVKRFSFSGENPAWIALHKDAAEKQAPDAEKWNGSDLILRDLATGNELNTGNVSEFAFDKKGQWLAVIIDAQGMSGNGVQLRNLTTSAMLPLDSARATYKGLSWTEKGDGLAVLRGTEDKAYQDKFYSVVAFTDLGGKVPRKIIYDPKTDKTFPSGMTISANRSPNWTEDLTAVLFGIVEPRKKDKTDEDKDKPEKGEADKKPADREDQEDPKGGRRGVPPTDPDRPDLVIWHWSDHRLQSQQQVQANTDRNYSYLSLVRAKGLKFFRLADDAMRQVAAAPKGRWAIGMDERTYELDGTLDGRRYQDVYVIDLTTGTRRLAVKKNRWYFGPSPDGSHFLYYDDGHFYTQEMAGRKTHNITREVPTSFVNDEDDHNVAKPPRFPVGWVKDGVSVLLSDGWDVWIVPVHGGKGINLTVNGRKDGIRYRRRIPLDPEEKGIDVSGPVYFSIYGEWTKKAGVARVDGGQPGAVRLLWDDAEFATVLKAKKADAYVYTRETAKDYPDYYSTDKSLRDGRRLTRANPQQEKFLWSRGSILVNYTSAKGTKLQGALFLPANYEENKRYPTIVYIYEKLSQGLHRYHTPTATGFNKSVYTSNGYAVLMPDIVYQINDPGRSACWCVLPALEAAIATGVVDRDRVAIHGHSWGGYQTAFLITQTDAFKAAVAGAPLTNLISMYSSIYWNTGSANQPIFESSQGRFTAGYWDELEAYTRNSPVYYARNVKTPLLLLHNDKDGAVDWNQGIEYFNTLRRLRKPVVLLQYKGENHGLLKPANQRDYTVRMQEFFDHYLRDKPAPAWLKEGIPHLKLDEHLKERSKNGITEAAAKDG
jgi:dipeptidyl aminopeptidase/acylaminoacyl peptidase